jgi:hypothetical protein
MDPKTSAEEALVALTSDDPEIQSDVRRVLALNFDSLYY